MIDELRRMALFGSGVVELTRYRAEQMVKGLVKSGELSPTGAPAMVQDLVERSKQTRKELTRFVRDEIKSQIEGLGLASKREIERLERRVSRLEDNLKKVREDTSSTRALDRRLDKLEAAATKAATAPSTTSTGKPVGDQPGTKPKSTAKKSTAKKSTPKKSAAKKSTGRKSTAKKTTAKKSTAQAITDAPAPRDPDGVE